MGVLADTLRGLFAERKADTVATVVPSWDDNRPQQQAWSYERAAREGYRLDEYVFACVGFRMDAMGEAPLCAYTADETKLTDGEHPGVTLLNHPNPFMGRARLWKVTSMHLDLAGDAYWHKVRSGAGKIIELWPLRPDRMSIVPSRTKYIGGYIYTIGQQQFPLQPEDVIHFQTPHPLNDYYGQSLIEVLAARIDLDINQRTLISALFRNAGIPFGMINIERKITTEAEREQIRRQFRADFGGANAFRVGVLDGGSASYTAMGMPLGAQGVAMPELDEMNEARICSVFGVLPSLVSTRLGMRSSSYANRVSDREVFWEQTQVPRYRDTDDMLTMGLHADFPDVMRFEHDLTKVKALQEDEDKKHARIREDFRAGLVIWTRAVEELGGDPEEEGIVLLQSTDVPTWTDEMKDKPEPVEPPPEPVAPPPPPEGVPGETPPTNGRANGVAAGH